MTGQKETKWTQKYGSISTEKLERLDAIFEQTLEANHIQPHAGFIEQITSAADSFHEFRQELTQQKGG